MQTKILDATDFIKTKVKESPKVGIVLGSGLGPFVDQVEDKIVIPYTDIPHFKACGVQGHEGKLIFGNIEGVSVALMAGRFHAYEGHALEDVVLPVRVLGSLGIKSVLLTNAAGGINSSYNPGDIILITDHINLTGDNVLKGPNMDFLGPRFPDMSHTYRPELCEVLQNVATKEGYNLKSGVYAGVLGPTYETPAEVRMLRTLGADLVGMSTVQEAIAANHMGVKVCGLSCVTNMAAGIEPGELKHEDIKDQAMQVMDIFGKLVKSSVIALGQ